jgi:hypothetical protein
MTEGEARRFFVDAHTNPATAYELGRHDGQIAATRERGWKHLMLSRFHQDTAGWEDQATGEWHEPSLNWCAHLTGIRTDGEVFLVQISIQNNDEPLTMDARLDFMAAKLQQALYLMEEFRSCACVKDAPCELHARKVVAK